MEKQTQFNMFKLMKKVQSSYSLSILLFSSSLVLLILHLIKSYSMTSLVSVMKFNIDRNHVFLICNGILVILVKSSSSLSSSSQDSITSDYSIGNNAVQNDQNLAKRTVLSDQRKQEEFSAVTSEQKVTTDVKMDQFSTVEDNVQVHVHIQEEELVVSECGVHVICNNDSDDHHQEDDHDDEEGEDAEELNKRCEEFIRRMKQGIISESRKDLGLTRIS